MQNYKYARVFNGFMTKKSQTLSKKLKKGIRSSQTSQNTKFDFFTNIRRGCHNIPTRLQFMIPSPTFSIKIHIDSLLVLTVTQKSFSIRFIQIYIENAL